MREYLALLGQSPLFHGISPQELEGMLPCLGARELQADKHQMIFRAGDPARWVGLVLSGAVHVIQEELWQSKLGGTPPATPTVRRGFFLRWGGHLAGHCGSSPGQPDLAAGLPAGLDHL